MSKLTRPPIPAELHRLVPWKSALYMAHAFGFFLVPAWLASIVVGRAWPWSWRAPLLGILVVLAGHGLQLLAFAGHEGLHMNLHRNKYISMGLAVLCSSFVPFFLIVGYSVTHWNHHRFANQRSDPDAEIFSRYKTFLTRLLFGRPKGLRMFMKNTFRLALGIHIPVRAKVPFSEKEMRWMARINIALALTSLTVYVTIFVRTPSVGLVVVGLPYLFLYVFTCLRAYIEHAGLGVGMFRDTRSYTSPIYTVLFFGGNYHLEHHVYPAAPSYNLPALHRHLARSGVYERAGSAIEPSFFGALRYITARYQYPYATEQDEIQDKFIDRIAEGQATEPPPQQESGVLLRDGSPG